MTFNDHQVKVPIRTGPVAKFHRGRLGTRSNDDPAATPDFSTSRRACLGKYLRLSMELNSSEANILSKIDAFEKIKLCF